VPKGNTLSTCLGGVSADGGKSREAEGEGVDEDGGAGGGATTPCSVGAGSAAPGAAAPGSPSRADGP
jgi:hypothetical protein